MTLPQEIWDEILEQISTDSGRPTLIACALVATRWRGRSQKLLFSSVDINEDNYERWVNGVVRSDSKARLLEYVHSMWYSRCLGSNRYRMQDLAEVSGEYLSALPNLHRLTFTGIQVGHISQAQLHACFSVFREALTYLFLDTFTTSFSAFVTLVGYFPHITTLRIGQFVLKLDEGPIPLLPRPFRGKLHVNQVQADYLEFFDRFAQLNPEYEELVISAPKLPETEFVESALQISASTVQFLRLTTQLRGEYSLPTVLIGITSLPNHPTFKAVLE